MARLDTARDAPGLTTIVTVVGPVSSTGPGQNSSGVVTVHYWCSSSSVIAITYDMPMRVLVLRIEAATWNTNGKIIRTAGRTAMTIAVRNAPPAIPIACSAK